MRLGYIRIRKGGPSETVQRRSLTTAGATRLYGDGETTIPKLRRDDPNEVLSQRSWALRHLNPGDQLVVHDAATLGTSAADILRVMMTIDQRDASLFVVETGATYYWHPQAAEIVAMAAAASTEAKREQTTNARRKLVENGGSKKLTPEMRARALELWSNPKIRSANRVAVMLTREFGTKVSVRTLYANLPGRKEAQAPAGA